MLHTPVVKAPSGGSQPGSPSFEDGVDESGQPYFAAGERAEANQALYSACRAFPAEVPLGIPVDMQTGGAIGERAPRAEQVRSSVRETTGAQIGPTMRTNDFHRPGESAYPRRGQAAQCKATLLALFEKRLTPPPVCSKPTGQLQCERETPSFSSVTLSANSTGNAGSSQCIPNSAACTSVRARSCTNRRRQS